jgi:hypothetical protein
MVEYSRTDIQRVNSSFNIVPFRKKKKGKTGGTFRLIDAMDLGIYLVVPLLVGLGIGLAVKQALIGLVLGALGSFFNLIKIVREFSKNA